MPSNHLQTPLPISQTSRSLRERVFRAVTRRLRLLLRLRRLYILRAALRFAPTEAQLLFALTIGIGVACGFAAVAFHLSIEGVEHRLIEPAMEAPGRAWMAWTILVPTLGGLLCGVLLEKVVPNARGSGIPQVKVAFARPGGGVRLRDAIGKFLIGSLQIGSGASLGREGPTVQICAGIASRLGKLVRLSPKSQRRLLPVGVAAGIAAAFNAPIAAVTFTIEEVVGNLDQAVLSGVIVAAALAAVIERSILGERSVFEVPTSYGLNHASSLLIYALIGLGAALASWLFSESLLRLRAWFRGLRHPPVWARPAIGGLVTGALAVVALEFLGSKGITGGGYATLGQALTGQLAVRVMLALSLLKIAATVFSYSSGGAGGIFAPSLFIGGTLGGAIGSLDATLLHHHEPSGAFALVGMGAVFAGVIRAPMTSVLIIVEMTRGYSLILPLMIANMTAYVIARRLRPQAIYEALLEQDGVHLGPNEQRDVLEQGRIEQSTDFSSTWRALSPGERASQISILAERNQRQHVYPVLDGERRVLGIITPDELEILRNEPELMPLANALDLMRLPVTVNQDDTLRAAFDAMLSHGIREVPVIDADGRFVGIISEGAIASAYARQRQESAELGSSRVRGASTVPPSAERPRA